MITNALKRSDGNINYPGIIAAWSAKGKTNDDADRAILKDLTGNGHDITLNGFDFSEMSGYGGYKTNMLNWKYNKNSAVILSSQNKFITYNTLEIATHFWDYVSEPPLGTIHRPSFKLKISGLNEDEAVYYSYVDGEDFSVRHEGNLYNGINIFPEINAEIVTEKLPYTTVFEIQSQRILDKEITFEILPEYPDALVFDGIDDYGFCKNIPLLKDYTIIAKRKDCNGGCLFNKGVNTRGAFILEGFGFISNTYNFGRGQNKNLLNNDIITWQNKNSYNQQSLIIGNDLDSTNQIIIGKLNDTDTRILKGAFYSAYLFDRSLDEQEIKAFIRKYIDPEYLLPSEIPTPDCYYDFSKGNNDDETRDTIKDYSGNGNDAVAHNFAWGGMSGYGGYKLKVFSPNNNNIVINTKTKYSVNFSAVFNSSQNYIELVQLDFVDNNNTIPAFKLKISGLKGGEYIGVGFHNYGNNIIDKLSNGIYIIPSFKNTTGIKNVIRINHGNPRQDITYENVTIELLPEYEGALVFDGVDDYVSLDAFDSGFKTVFMVCIPLALNGIFYDQRKESNNIYAFGSSTGQIKEIAYNRANNTKQYINGILNTTIDIKDLLNKKQLIHNIEVLANEENSQSPKLAGSLLSSIPAKICIYKFLGFKEALTEEQIQAVIKKYNLLDGVDEIEVS